MNAYDIIRRPVITEQSMEAVADKKYVFMVDVNANKTSPAGKRAEYKKAVVTLTADSKTIEFFEGMV